MAKEPYTFILYKRFNKDNVRVIEWLESENEEELGEHLELLIEQGRLTKRRHITNAGIFFAQVIGAIEIN